MTATLGDAYLSWLYSQVGDVKERNTSRTYWKLFRRMHQLDFVWLIPNDDNRVEDGRELRYEWSEEAQVKVPSDWWQAPGCSFLEMIIALSRHLAFEGEGHPDTWFWHLIENLGLQNCTDRRFNLDEVDDRITQVVLRTYQPDGVGGLFPLRHARRDQRDVELWYQMQAYLIEG